MLFDAIIASLGPGGLIAILAWLSKEMISNFVMDRSLAKQKKLELKSYKQKANFDLKYKIYSEVYGKIKELQGYLIAFRDLEQISYTKIDNAVEYNEGMDFYRELTEEAAELTRKNYHMHPKSRCAVNINYYLNVATTKFHELKNHVALNEFLFEEKEALKIKELNDSTIKIIEYVGKVYTERASKLLEDNGSLECSSLIKEMEKDLNNNLFKMLDENNTLIKEVDDLFKAEFK